MALFGRKKRIDVADDQESTESARRRHDDEPTQHQSAGESVASSRRQSGPWDVTERDATDSYLDLGALRVRGREGHEIRLQSEHGEDQIRAALIVGEEEALELRAFAGPTSGGQWEQVRADIIAEVARLEGQVTEADGPYGPELHVQIPVELDDGQSGVQPSRILGIEGPRWMLRATLLGKAAIEPVDDGDLMDTLRDTIVVRGEVAMMAREPLLLTPPEQAVVVAASQDDV